MKASIIVGIAVLSLASVSGPASAADQFQLNGDNHISCGRGLSAGKLSTATCRTYAYLFDKHTSESFRCTASLAMTRDNKQVLNVQADGNCTRRPRIFGEDGDYSFNAAETEPPNTNSFFGAGGYSAWASDNSARRVKACLTIISGLGTDVARCVDMTIE
jgi:hypothetical protein